MNVQNAEFVTSVADPSGFMPKKLPEIAFIGKSNVGKSSVINCILRRNNFARTGNTPGKTIHANFFCIDKKCYFVDLPGYGYAKVPEKEKARWSILMETYFSMKRIDLGVFIVDARHTPTKDDITMAQWFNNSGCPYIVVANKADKLNKTELTKAEPIIRTALHLPEEIQVILFSCVAKTGRDDLYRAIDKIIQ